MSIKVAYAENFLDYIFRPLGGINVAGFYENYWYAIDFILYMIVFLGISRVSLEKHFTGRGGQALVLVMGIMLTIAMTWFASSIDFRIVDLWPIAAGIFIAIIAILIFRLIAHQGGNLKAGVATAYVITFLTIQAIMPELFGRDGWIAQNVPIMWGIANIVFLVAIVYMIGEIGRWLSHGRTTEGRDDWPIRGREGGPGGEGPRETPNGERPGGEGHGGETPPGDGRGGPGEPTPPEWEPEIRDVSRPPFMSGRIGEGNGQNGQTR